MVEASLIMLAESLSLFSEMPYSPRTTVLDFLTSYTAAAMWPGVVDCLSLPAIFLCFWLAQIKTPPRGCWLAEKCDGHMPYFILVFIIAL